LIHRATIATALKKLNIEKQTGIRFPTFRTCLEMLKIDVGAEALSRDPAALKKFKDIFSQKTKKTDANHPTHPIEHPHYQHAEKRTS
jgi:hypothetical protein